MTSAAAPQARPDEGSLVDALARLLTARTGQPVERRETHISWILLSGDEVWKLKRPVRLPFVDFTRPETRHRCCEAEVRLNRRLAPGLYLGVLAVTGSADALVVEPVAERPSDAADDAGAAADATGSAGGATGVLDWIVRMRRFPAGALFAERLADGVLTADDVERLARRLAAFDALAEVQSDPVAADATAVEALKAVDRLQRLAPQRDGAQWAVPIARIAAWLTAAAARLRRMFGQRLQAGRVRDVHGDLHLANAIVHAGDVTAFDCLEFDDRLRRIDVIGDPAFLSMDLIAHGRPDLAHRHVDAWCEAADDWQGLAVLRFHQVYRAAVRALVAWLGAPAGQPGAARYLRTALSLIEDDGRRPVLTITHGLSGSGKSFAALRRVEREGAIRLRSDVERKRLAGLAPLADSRAAGLDLYTPEWSARTYARLAALAETVLSAGCPVVVDAAFLKRAERQEFAALARRRGADFRILDCQADTDSLRQRIVDRARVGADPSEATPAVLARQLGFVEPLDADERRAAVVERHASRGA
ncbi:MAG: AAA family ATPase [Lautropia sp.]